MLAPNQATISKLHLYAIIKHSMIVHSGGIVSVDNNAVIQRRKWSKSE